MASQISKISFKNYKSFNEASIDISPLSILVGANSTGKSALLKLVLLISQSLSAESSGLFVQNGPLVEMGDRFNIFPKYDRDAEIELRFHFRKRVALSIALEGFYTTVRMAVRRELAALAATPELRSAATQLRTRLMNSTDFEALQFASRLLDKHAEHIEEGEGTEGEGPIRKDFKGLEFSANLAQGLFACAVDSVSYQIRYSHKADSPVIAKVVLFDSENVVMHYRSSDYKNMGVGIYIRGVEQAKLTRHYKDVRQVVRSRSFRFFRRPAKAGMLSSQSAIVNPVGFFIGSVLSGVTGSISQEFSEGRVRHVSPLRAYPRRYYLLDGRDYEKAETERIISILRENPGVVNEVNHWLGRLGQSIELEQLHDSIFRIMVTDGALSSDLTDVGFGLSQILPVILEPIISEDDELIVIQQPEIHLHPRAQSVLADFFIWAIKNKGCSIFVETHSEYLLRRLRRRIGEGVFAPELPTAIPKESVSLMSVEKAGGVSVVNKLELDENGDFKWPKDFLDDEVEDLLAFASLTATTEPLQPMEGAKQ